MSPQSIPAKRLRSWAIEDRVRLRSLRLLRSDTLTFMEVSIFIPDTLAGRLLNSGDAARQVLEAFALEAYREDKLALVEVSELLGLTRVETEDLLGQHRIPLADLTAADLDREAAILRELVPRAKS